MLSTDCSQKELKMAVLFPLFPPPLFLSPILNLFRWVARSGGGEKWPKIFWKVVEGRVSSLIHSRRTIQEFKRWHRTIEISTQWKTTNYFHHIFPITMKTILWYNNNFQVYLFLFFFFFHRDHIENQNHSINLYTSERINAIL